VHILVGMIHQPIAAFLMPNMLVSVRRYIL